MPDGGFIQETLTCGQPDLGVEPGASGRTSLQGEWVLFWGKGACVQAMVAGTRMMPWRGGLFWAKARRAFEISPEIVRHY